MGQMSYEEFQRMVQRFDEEQAKKYNKTGMKPPKLTIRDTTKTINANISNGIYEALIEASRITGMTQRALIEKALSMSLSKIVHQTTKTQSYWRR